SGLPVPAPANPTRAHPRGSRFPLQPPHRRKPFFFSRLTLTPPLPPSGDVTASDVRALVAHALLDAVGGLAPHSILRLAASNLGCASMAIRLLAPYVAPRSLRWPAVASRTCDSEDSFPCEIGSLAGCAIGAT